jgi:hypothetical protein
MRQYPSFLNKALNFFAAINEHQKNTLCHKLFKDVYSINQADVVEKMYLWAPLFVHLAMTFRDINQMFYCLIFPCFLLLVQVSL